MVKCVTVVGQCYLTSRLSHVRERLERFESLCFVRRR